MLEDNKEQFAEGTVDRKSIDLALKNQLTPYIESVRFPFTGVSSVQPYEAKLIKDEQYGGLAKHSLIAPGLPEMDFASFDAAKKKVEAVIDTLNEARSAEYSKPSPNMEHINHLTTTITNLDEAIARVIPMYIAQQQKLDFDGDQIEIHSAKTATARKEIEQHYESLTNADMSAGTTTERMHRRDFTYGAKVQSTGKYNLTPNCFASSIILRASGIKFSSTNEFPISCPKAFKNVNAIPPPIMILSTFGTRLCNASSFPETFDPPTIDTKGLFGLCTI